MVYRCHCRCCYSWHGRSDYLQKKGKTAWAGIRKADGGILLSKLWVWEKFYCRSLVLRFPLYGSGMPQGSIWICLKNFKNLLLFRRKCLRIYLQICGHLSCPCRGWRLWHLIQSRQQWCSGKITAVKSAFIMWKVIIWNGCPVRPWQREYLFQGACPMVLYPRKPLKTWKRKQKGNPVSHPCSRKVSRQQMKTGWQTEVVRKIRKSRGWHWKRQIYWRTLPWMTVSLCAYTALIRTNSCREFICQISGQLPRMRWALQWAAEECQRIRRGVICRLILET